MSILRLLILLTALSMLHGYGFAQGVKLLDHLPESTARSASVERTLQSVRKRQHLTDTKLTKLNSTAFDSDWIYILLPDRREIQINRTFGSSKSKRDFTWIGEVRKGGGEAIFTVTDGVLIGNIRLPATTYTIEPLGEDLYLLSRVVREMIPPPDPASGPARESKEQSSVVVLPKRIASVAAAAANSPVVRVLIAYTQASSDYFNGATATAVANQALASLNQAFANSGVSIQAELAGTVSVAFTETGNFLNDLGSLRVNPTLVATRNGAAADIVITLFGRLTTGDNLCGLAYINPSSEYSYGIVVAQWLNAAGDCFAHEVGHIFGADHNTANATSSPFAYGHGYQYTPTSHPDAIQCFRTIMAYDFSCPVGSIFTPNNFSNPSVNIQYYNLGTGVPTFTVPSGNAVYANNARVLNETAATVAAFRGSPSTPGSPGTPQSGAAMSVVTQFILSE